MLFLGIINSRTVQPVAANERAVSTLILIRPLYTPPLHGCSASVGVHNET